MNDVLFPIPPNGPQVAEGGQSQTLKRSTDMDNETNIPNEEQTGRLQQPAVGGSLPPAQQIRKWCREAHFKAEQYRGDGIEEMAAKYYAMALAYSKCVTLLERQ